ncbi:MAG: hypothetical protein NVS4B2_03750 [Chloroflexota bacterium]
MPISHVTINPLEENIYAIDAPCEADVDVRALLVCGQRFSLLIDTLLRPSDLQSVAQLVAGAGGPLLIVNTHADWDHWWGNAAFPNVPIIAHQRTRSRQIREGKRSLASRRRKDPSGFAEIELRPATVTFSEALDLDLGDIQVELRALPGHTSDCIVAYLPERHLLFAGDAAENPIPLLNEGVIGSWPELLDVWARRSRIVVPAHGAIAGPELLERNAAYLRGLRDNPAGSVPELDGAPAFYRTAHRRNLKRAAGAS